jgi:hypothetical protein
MHTSPPHTQEARDAISEYQRTTAAQETARREKESAPIREVSSGSGLAVGWGESAAKQPLGACLQPRKSQLCAVLSMHPCAVVPQALKPELQALYDAANKGWTDLLKHVYTQHPPLNPANR